ncbi:MAG: haloacid dehalogenase [Frankiales bacterium]|nr:haloacid dehalogenase [Frankiales bacterium]
MPFADGVQVVGVDGDDTLWLCQDGFDAAEASLARLAGDGFAAELEAVSRRNLRLYGYGVKAWTLNCLEAAGPDLQEQVLAHGRALLAAPVELLPGAAEALDALAAAHRVVLVTKGDLVDQRRKLAASGLADRFDHVEIVADKDVPAYQELLRFLGCPAERFLMVGNSEVSDVAPVLAAGGWAVHVPHTTTWALERAAPTEHPRRVQVASLGQVPALLQGGLEG